MAITGKDQIAHGIEFIALSWYYRIQRQELSLEQLVEFLVELIHGIGSPEASLSLKNANNWKKKTEDFFGIVADLQQRSIVVEGEQLFEMASFYLRSFADTVNDEGLRVLLAASPMPSQRENPMEILYRLVFFRYAVEYGLKVDISYSKLMEDGVESRRIIPVSLQSLDGIIDLTALDTAANDIRHFILSRIVDVQTDLRAALLGAEHARPSLPDPNPSKHREFGNARYDCLLELRGRSYDHFCHRFLVPHEVVEQTSGRVTIRLPNIGDRRIRDIVFNYGEYCTLLEPRELRERFRGIAEKIVRNHQ